MTISTGATLDVTTSNYALSVAGNWSDSGTFTARNGTVTLNAANGVTQTISGSTTFYNLTKIVSGTSTLTLSASQAQTIATGGTLTLMGASSNLLTLQSSSTTKAILTLASGAGYVIQYVNPNYIDSSAGTAILDLFSTSNSNDLNWSFASPTGTVLYWIGGTGNWSGTSNWSLTPERLTQECIPHHHLMTRSLRALIPAP